MVIEVGVPAWGLAICRASQAHGGRIWWSPETAVAPASSSSCVGKCHATVDGALEIGGRTHMPDAPLILIVEDEKPILRFLTASLAATTTALHGGVWRTGTGAD